MKIDFLGKIKKNKQLKIVFLVFFAQLSFAQTANFTTKDIEDKAVKKSISFSHQPFLLLKITPTAFFGYNNTFQYGAEIAPPFGKFSFGLDYGKGTGKQNFNKTVRKQFADNKNTVIRGEIRMYFSDWYPFYALDKKPFGRYYAVEYVNTKHERNRSLVNTQGGGQVPNDLIMFKETTQAINLKFGRHIHLSKFLFLDVFAGLGIGKYIANDTEAPTDITNIVPLKLKYFGKNSVRNPNTKGLFFSKTAGLRLALPI
jgi:hypothetical protein